MAIERKFIEQNMREYKIKTFIHNHVERAGLSEVKVKKTPLGDKIVIFASRPGLVVGRGGSNIKELTAALKNEFELENPQIEIEEVKKADLDADIVAERICNSLERFGAGRTKGIGHRTLNDVMRAGALGVEILITGKIPSMRSRRWRFYAGYLKKAGDIAIEGVRTSIQEVTLKSGAVGVQVRIMPPDLVLPDHIALIDQAVEVVEEPEDEKSSKKEKTDKKPAKKKAASKKADKAGKKSSKKSADKKPAKKKASTSKKASKDESASDAEEDKE